MHRNVRENLEHAVVKLVAGTVAIPNALLACVIRTSQQFSKACAILSFERGDLVEGERRPDSDARLCRVDAREPQMLGGDDVREQSLRVRIRRLPTQFGD